MLEKDYQEQLLEYDEFSIQGAGGNTLRGDAWKGEGAPVILLHGGGQTRHAWKRTAQRLAKANMRPITIDLRGHGQSDWVSGGHYSFDEFGKDAREIIDSVAQKYGEQPHGVGASLGGLSFLCAEAEFGPLLKSLVLVDIVPMMKEDGVSKIRGFMTERMHEGFASLEEAAQAIAQYLPDRAPPKSLSGLSKNLRKGDDGRYRWHWDPAFYSGNHSVSSNGLEKMTALDAKLPSLQLPMLLVRGMNSELVDEVTAQETVARIPHGQYKDVSGAGHMVAGDKNDIFCDAILEFLNQT